MSRMRRAWSRPSNNQKRVGVPFALPPLLDQLSKSPEIVYFVADSYLSCATYSDANKNSGIVWDEATFKEYIKDPKAKIPGTKMVFPGIKNEKEADDLWSYIEQFGPDGKKR